MQSTVVNQVEADRILRLVDVLPRLPYSIETLRRRIKDGTVPIFNKQGSLLVTTEIEYQAWLDEGMPPHRRWKLVRAEAIARLRRWWIRAKVAEGNGRTAGGNGRAAQTTEPIHGQRTAPSSALVGPEQELASCPS